MQFGVSDHEQVVFRRDAETGLVGVIALHSTRLGPAAGGCRRWQYVTEDAAIADALRLSEGMTYKNALAGLPFGGGKSVIMADQHRRPTSAQLARFAQWLNDLQGAYITAEDVGMGLDEARALARGTPFVSGLGQSGVGGDPSPKTAYGVFLGLKTAVQYGMGLQHLHGVAVGVQGLGSVGMSLCHWLARAGARVYVTDIDPQRVREAESRFAAVGVAPDEIIRTPMDVFAPCALGGVITEEVAASTPVQIIAGAANNQLASSAAGDVLAQRGILYAPDFVINAGGVISVAHEYLTQTGQFAEHAEHSAEQWVGSRVDGIAQRLLDIFESAKRSGAAPDTVARARAMQIVQAGPGQQLAA